jgi:integrase
MRPSGWNCSGRCSSISANITAMRLDEIFRVSWGDLNEKEKLLTIRDRKDPRLKKGNNQEIPLLSLTGFDALSRTG